MARNLVLSKYRFNGTFVDLHIISWNQRKSQQTGIWTRQDFPSWLTGSNLLFAVSSYGMGKEGQKGWDLSLAGLLLVTCSDGHPKDWPVLAKMVHEMKMLIKIFIASCSIMSIWSWQMTLSPVSWGLQQLYYQNCSGTTSQVTPQGSHR